jgi:hypothetical protein
MTMFSVFSVFGTGVDERNFQKGAIVVSIDRARRDGRFAVRGTM